MAKIEIPKSETGVIRVFSVSRPMAQMARALKQQSKAHIASDLLAHPVTDSNFELFALSDLAGVGLAGYLTDGYAVAIHTDKRRLEALDGYVLVLFSNVAQTDAITLSPTPDLTLIGTYTERPGSRASVPIVSEAAKPYSGVTEAPQAPPRSRTGSAMVAVTVIVTLLLLWWIFT